jgi:hypothetical protein
VRRAGAAVNEIVGGLELATITETPVEKDEVVLFESTTLVWRLSTPTADGT